MSRVVRPSHSNASTWAVIPSVFAISADHRSRNYVLWNKCTLEGPVKREVRTWLDFWVKISVISLIWDGPKAGFMTRLWRMEA